MLRPEKVQMTNTETRNVSKGHGCLRLKKLKGKLLTPDADGGTGAALNALSTILRIAGAYKA